jgi:hypothetical protein
VETIVEGLGSVVRVRVACLARHLRRGGDLFQGGTMRNACLSTPNPWSRLALRLGALAALAAGTSCSNTTGSTSGTPTGSCDTLKEAQDSAFCAGDPTTTDCSLVTPAYTEQVCGVPIEAPQTAIARSPDVMQYAGSGPPQLSCFTPAGYPQKPGTPQTVTVSGVAQIFSHGLESSGVTIEFHTVVHGGSDDGNIGPLVGTAVTTPASCDATNAVMVTSGCGQRFECRYAYPGVPTETDLVVKTYGDNWAPLYDYNHFIQNSAVAAGMWTYNVQSLENSDYELIAQAAVGQPIPAGHGAVAGEVHDCGNVRLQNAVVNLSVEKGALVYFGDNEENPLPDQSRTGTSTLGLYAAVDVAPGPVTVAAVGQYGGQITTLGYYRAYVFPNAVTAVTFDGVPPFDLQ